MVPEVQKGEKPPGILEVLSLSLPQKVDIYSKVEEDKFRARYIISVM